jgi:hypothetical protein
MLVAADAAKDAGQDAAKKETKKLEPIADPSELVRKCADGIKEVKDYTCRLHKQERINGELRPEQTMDARFRVAPHSVLVKWTSEPYTHRQVLYVDGQHDGKLLVYLADWPVFKGVMQLRPDSNEALKDSLHPISMAGIKYLVDRMVKQFDEAVKAGRLSAEVTVEELDGRQTYRLVRVLDDGGKRTWNVDPETWLPVRVATCDKDGQLLETYWYRDLKTNVGLKDEDFDPAKIW